MPDNDDAPSYPATREEVVQCFLRIPYDHLVSYNWGTAAPGADRDEWLCNDESYINGVVMTIDGDYIMGYLIEVVDRTTGIVTFHAIATFHGRDPITGKQDHDSAIYLLDCGTFFDRTEAADRVTVCQWAVSQIFGLFEAYHDRQAHKFNNRNQ
jgi:hypothetical protein